MARFGWGSSGLALSVLLFGGLTLQSLVAGAREPDSGTLWALRGVHNTVYIAGSMHMLAANDATLPAALQHAYANAERLIMEIDIDDLDPAAAGAFTQTNGTLANGAPDLQEQLGKRRWEQVQRQCTRLSLPCDTLRRLEPWALALVMSVSELTRLGLDPQLGVEEQLRRQAAADHKEIGGLETLEFQLGLFDALRGPEQLQLLDMTLAEMGRQNDAVDKLSRAWRRGDLRTLEGLLLGEYRRFPALYDTLVYRRNAKWVPQVRELLQRGDDYLVVVGALHLVGPRGLIALLARAGLKPQRILTQ